MTLSGFSLGSPLSSGAVGRALTPWGTRNVCWSRLPGAVLALCHGRCLRLQGRRPCRLGPGPSWVCAVAPLSSVLGAPSEPSWLPDRPQMGMCEVTRR